MGASFVQKHHEADSASRTTSSSNSDQMAYRRHNGDKCPNSDASQDALEEERRLPVCISRRHGYTMKGPKRDGRSKGEISLHKWTPALSLFFFFLHKWPFSI